MPSLKLSILVSKNVWPTPCPEFILQCSTLSSKKAKEACATADSITRCQTQHIWMGNWSMRGFPHYWVICSHTRLPGTSWSANDPNFICNFIQATSLKPNLLYRTFLGSDPLLWSLAMYSWVQYPGAGNGHHFLESLERPSVASFDQLLVFCWSCQFSGYQLWSQTVLFLHLPLSTPVLTHSLYHKTVYALLTRHNSDHNLTLKVYGGGWISLISKLSVPRRHPAVWQVERWLQQFGKGPTVEAQSPSSAWRAPSMHKTCVGAQVGGSNSTSWYQINSRKCFPGFVRKSACPQNSRKRNCYW